MVPLPEVIVHRVSWLWWRQTPHKITGCLTADSFKLWLDGEPAFHLCRAGHCRSTLMTFLHGEVTLDKGPRAILIELFGLKITSYLSRMAWDGRQSSDRGTCT